MEDLVALSRYLKDNYSDAELRMARYIFETDLLTYSVPLNKGKQGEADSNISNNPLDFYADYLSSFRLHYSVLEEESFRMMSTTFTASEMVTSPSPLTSPF